MTRVFCFGTLLTPRVQLDVFGRLIAGPIAEVPGVYVDHSDDFPRLRGWPGVSAIGRVLELSDEELSAACKYEGHEYLLAEVTLKDKSKAWVFV